MQVSELLVEKEGEIYEFAHLSFQEFLAAAEIVRIRQELMLYDVLGSMPGSPQFCFMPV